MKVDYDLMEAKRIPEFKGGTGVAVLKMFEDDSIKIIKGYLEENSSIGMHKHVDSSETIYILSGEGKIINDAGEEFLKAGDCSYCSQGESHSLVNTGKEPLYFIGVVPVLQ